MRNEIENCGGAIWRPSEVLQVQPEEPSCRLRSSCTFRKFYNAK